MQQTQELKAMAQEAGCDLVGIADLRPFKSERATVALDLLDRFANAISVAVHLDDAIIDSIEGAPTIAYAQHYRRVNATLDAKGKPVYSGIGGLRGGSSREATRRTRFRPPRSWTRAICWGPFLTRKWPAWLASAGKVRVC